MKSEIQKFVNGLDFFFSDFAWILQNLTLFKAFYHDFPIAILKCLFKTEFSSQMITCTTPNYFLLVLLKPQGKCKIMDKAHVFCLEYIHEAASLALRLFAHHVRAQKYLWRGREAIFEASVLCHRTLHL